MADDFDYQPITISWESLELEPMTDFHVLAGKVLGNKKTRRRTLMVIFKGIWQCGRPWQVKEFRPGIFIFIFRTEVDKERVLAGRPWTVKGQHLILNSWDPMLLIEQVDLRPCPFWVRFEGLPKGYLDAETAKEIAALFGEFIEFSDDRLRVSVDSEKPLLAGFFLREREDDERPVWIQSKFEKLGKVCYKCGVLGHGVSECSRGDWVRVESEHSPSVVMYGPWIRDGSSIESCFSGLEKFIG